MTDYPAEVVWRTAGGFVVHALRAADLRAYGSTATALCGRSAATTVAAWTNPTGHMRGCRWCTQLISRRGETT